MATTYTEATPGLVNRFGICWSDPATGASWIATSFTLTIGEVGVGAPTNLHGASTLSHVTYYPIHGTFHTDCTPPSDQATGTVSVDVTF
jgi:hypothetical protein